MSEAMKVLWQKNKKGNVRIVRAYGCTPFVHIPGEIEELPVEEVADYCFSSSEKLPQGELSITYIGDNAENEEMRLLAGEYIEKLHLPSDLTTIGNSCFYNCVNLTKISFGTHISEVGSGVFMNCNKLAEITIRSSAAATTGLQQILSRITTEVEVMLTGLSETSDSVEAKLLYPEYYEIYDEIAPAHIFGCNITGEGFRARQCFQNGKIDFPAYDGIFNKAKNEESREIAFRMAMNRLLYPVDLKNVYREEYEDFLKENSMELLTYYVRVRGLDELKYLCENRLAEDASLEIAIAASVTGGWTEGAAFLLDIRHRLYNKMETKKHRYDF